MSFVLRKVFSILLIFALLCCPVLAFRQPEGGIDWVGGYASGTGYGTAKPSGSRMRDRMLALRAAEIGAYRALAETIRGVKVEANILVEDVMSEPVIRSRVEGLVRGAQTVHSSVLWEADTPFATIEMHVCLNAKSPECQADQSLLLAVLEEPGSDFLGEETKDFSYSSSDVVSDLSIVYDRSRPVTGLVLSVDGSLFERTLFPAVVAYNSDGEMQRVYSAKLVRPEIVRTFGVVRYSISVEDALQDTRLGNNAIVCKAHQVTNENYLVITGEEAKLVKESTYHGNNYLADAKVTIVSKR